MSDTMVVSTDWRDWNQARNRIREIHSDIPGDILDHILSSIVKNAEPVTAHSLTEGNTRMRLREKSNTTPNQNPPSPRPNQENKVIVSEDFIRFLLGETDLNNSWFGDDHPRGSFWWRTDLRNSIDPVPNDTRISIEFVHKVYELCSAVENEDDLPPVKYGMRCGLLISELMQMTEDMK